MRCRDGIVVDAAQSLLQHCRRGVGQGSAAVRGSACPLLLRDVWRVSRAVDWGPEGYKDVGPSWSRAEANRPGSVTAKPCPKQASRGRNPARRRAERRFCW